MENVNHNIPIISHQTRKSLSMGKKNVKGSDLYSFNQQMIHHGCGIIIGTPGEVTNNSKAWWSYNLPATSPTISSLPASFLWWWFRLTNLVVGCFCFTKSHWWNQSIPADHWGYSGNNTRVFVGHLLLKMLSAFPFKMGSKKGNMV